jgi:membrane associated rhomboid family serine protease
MNKNQIQNSIQKSYNHVRYYFMRLPKITRYMVIALMGFFLLGQFVDLSFFVLKKFGFGFNPIQMFTYAFLQYDFMQLLFNVLAIWMFGYQIEEYWGTRRFATFVITTILATALAHVLLGSLFAVGISGLVFALLLAYGMMWPEREIYLLLPPIPVKAKYLVMIYAGIMFLSILSSQGSFLSHLAYLAGPLSGFLLIQYWRGKPPFSKKPKSKSKGKLYRYK